MATRCLIGNLKEGKVTYIYCHFDGYPEVVGVCLSKHYTKERKVLALLQMGDLVLLGAKLKTKGNYKATFSNTSERYEDDCIFWIVPSFFKEYRLEHEETYGSPDWLKKNWDDIEFVYLRRIDGWYYKGWDGSVWHKIN